MSDFRNFVKEQLQDPEFRKEYEAAHPEYDFDRSLIIDGMTQNELSEKSSISLQ